MNQRILLCTILLLTLSACLKEELPVPMHERGEAISVQACMGPGYQDQLWLDIRSGTVVSSNPKTAWDLAFESAADGWRIYLNGAKLMTAWNLGAVDISAAHDTTGMAANKRIDAPSGDRDSTAIGDWRAGTDVYLLDLGVDGFGVPQGLRKVRFVSVTASAFTFNLGALDGSGLDTITVQKDPTRSFTSYKFGTGVVPIEPVRGTWDLVLTQYTHQFYEPFLPYIVTGILAAPTTRTAVIPNADFAAVALGDTVAHPFSAARDAIGYGWKEYSFETSSYTVDRTKVYIVEDADGFFLKLRFVEFYGPQGQVGCPLFEVAPL